MTRLVGVLIDYQNCYMAAREAFQDSKNDPSHLGNVRPLSLANLLASKGPGAHKIAYVGVYCGLADPRRDPKTHAARQRQIKAWQADGVTVFARPLRYPPPWAAQQGERPREKGVDVKLALDAVLLAVERKCETIIVASCDTDLDALAEALLELQGTTGNPNSVEAIAWAGRSNKLSERAGLTFRWIGEKDYKAVQDLTDYVQT